MKLEGYLKHNNHLYNYFLNNLYFLLIQLLIFLFFLFFNLILIFYFFRGRTWWDFLAQFLLLAYVNIEVLSGYAYEIPMFGTTYYLVRQGFALFALIPIWLYHGKQGPYNKVIKSVYYAFYPVHMLFLILLRSL